MKTSDKGHTTRYSLEVSTGWAEDHPELFTKAVADFAEVAIQHDLFNIKMDIDRVGFYTFTETPMEQNNAEAK